MHKLLKLLKENSLFQLLSSKLFVQVTTILQSIIVSRLLGPTGKGEFTEAILWPTLVASLSMFGLYTAIVRISAKKELSRRVNITKSVIRVTLITGLFGTIIAYFVNTMMFATDSFLLVAQFYAVYALIYNVNRGLSAINNGRGNMGIFSISASILNPVFFLGILVLYLLDKISINTLLIALMLANFSSLVFLYCVRERSDIKRTLSPCALLKYSIRFSPSDFSEPLYAYYDKAIIAFVLSAYDLGLYTIAYSAAAMINVISATFATQLFSDVARGSCDHLHRYIRVNLITMVLMSMLMCVVLPFAIPLVFGADFRPAVPISLLLLIVCILQGQSSIIERAILARGFPYVGIQAKMLTMGVYLIGAFVFYGLGISSLYSLSMLLILVQAVYLAYMQYRMKGIFGAQRMAPNVADVSDYFKRINRFMKK